MSVSDKIIAASTIIYRGYDFDVALSSIAETGFRWVEPALIGSYFPEISDAFFDSKKATGLRNTLSQAGLRVYSVGAHMDLGLPEALESFRRRIAFAEEIGAKVIVSNAATRAKASSFYSNMETLAQEAEGASLIIALENPGDGAGSILGDATESLQVIRTIDSPHVRLNYDYCNVYTYSQGSKKPEEEYLKAWPVVAHLHLKDVKPLDGGLRFCSVGSGIINYAPLFDTIDAGSIPMSIEMPLFLERGPNFEMVRRDGRTQLPVIEKVLKASLDFVTRNLSGMDVSNTRVIGKEGNDSGV